MLDIINYLINDGEIKFKVKFLLLLNSKYKEILLFLSI